MPYCRPASPARRDAQNASATAARRVAHEQRALQRERHPLDDAPRAQLDRLGVGELVAQRGGERVQARVGAGGLVDLVEERLSTSGEAAERAQDVERHDVARALPDRGQRHLAVQPRHAGLLDVAVAAEALERLERVARPALADPVLADRRGEALECAARVVARAAGRLVVGAREAHRERRRGLGLDAQVGEHVAHERLVGEPLAERAAVRRVPRRVGDAPAHAGGGADHAVQARVADHLDDRRHAAAGLADELRPGAVQLDLARGVGAVAELVLQALQVQRVARAVGQDPRQREAGDALAAACARTRNRSHIGAEQNHLWPVSSYSPSAAARSGRATVVFARTSEPPCFSVIAMPHSALAFAPARRRTGS